MNSSRLFAIAVASLLLAEGALAQTAPDAGTTAPATKKKASSKRGSKKSSKKTPPPPPAPAPAPQPGVDDATAKALEAAQPKPAPAPAPAPAPEPGPTVADDNDPPSITHTPVTKAMKGKPLAFTARITDPSGVFQPVLYIRKKGMGSGDYIPIKMIASRASQGDYNVEVPPALVGVDLEYYIEAYDNAGNGPTRGSPENPLPVQLQEEKKQIIVAPKAPEPTAPQPTVTIKPKGAPPAISHTAVTQATKGQPIEINAKLIAETGVSGAKVFFRHVGEKEYKELPMGDIGGENFTATVPAQQATGDIEYYLEAFDKYGNGPGRSGAPSIPYKITVLEPVAPGITHVTVGTTTSGAGNAPRLVKAPFKPNPGRMIGWMFMAGFVGSSIFAGGEALGAWKANDEYTHTFDYEGRLEPQLLNNANDYGKRAKTSLIIATSTLVVSIVLLIVFPEHPDTVMVGGGGGDAGVIRF